MMAYETRCVRIKLKPGKLDRVREWARTLNETRRDEALATLRGESVIIEAYFLDRTDDGECLIAFMKAESFEQSRRAVEASSHDIDRYHQTFKADAWESVRPLEVLVDLDLVPAGPGMEGEK
jgi:hypothetical protein